MCTVCAVEDRNDCIRCGKHEPDATRYEYSTTTKKFHPLCGVCARKT